MVVLVAIVLLLACLPPPPPRHHRPAQADERVRAETAELRGVVSETVAPLSFS
jgi:hypothetical protein|eukprot:COSAG01_NODE_9709_length_2364_cov_1.722296_2_plen_53_part_00